MCSVAGGDGQSEPQKRMPYSTIERKCMKCHENEACMVICMNDPICRGCFISYASHKFRSAFGKSKLIRDQETVLVAVSGGQSSSAMIHLIETGLSKRAQKKLRFIPHLLFIDEGAVLGQTEEERCQFIQQVAALTKVTSLGLSVCSLEQSMSLVRRESAEVAATAAPVLPVDSRNTHQVSLLSVADLHCHAEYIQSCRPDREKLEKMLKSVKSLTAKENLVHHLRLKLLAAIGRHLGILKVMVGDSGTRIAIRLLSNITQGQGKHLPSEVGFADARYKDITFIRPMREFTAKEISVYNRLEDINSVFIPSLDTKVPSHCSIGRLTEDFVMGLQADYPNTVSTVFRTGEKFDNIGGRPGSSSDSENSTEMCCLCQCTMDTTVGKCSALAATDFSQKLCNMMSDRMKIVEETSEREMLETCTKTCSDTTSCARDGDSTPQGCCGEGIDSCQQQNKLPTRLGFEDLEHWLCYGCRLLVKDMVEVDCLPDDVLHDATQRGQRAHLKEQISDYLLD